MNLGPTAKAVIGALVAGVAPYTAALQPTSQLGGRVSLGEWLTVVVAVLVGARLVWQADNVRWFKYAKATAAAVVTFLGPLVVILLADGWPSQTDVLNALVQVVIAFGVVSQVPNAPESEWHDPIGGDGDPEPTDGLHTAGGPTSRAPYIVLDDGSTVPSTNAPVDEDGDGRDDNTGRYLPGHQGRLPRSLSVVHHTIMPGGALALILGGAVTR